MTGGRLARITLRRSMVVVAVLAVILAVGEGLRRRRREFLRSAARHERSARDFKNEASGWKFTFDLVRNGRSAQEQTPPAPPIGLSGDSAVGGFEAKWLDWARGYARLASYHADLGRKYRYAAAHPWFPVARDPIAPPEPETPEPIVWDAGAEDYDFIRIPAPASSATD